LHCRPDIRPQRPVSAIAKLERLHSGRRPYKGTMKIRQLIGGILILPSMFGMSLLWISGAILHFFTAYMAYGMAGQGFGALLVGGAAFAFPILAEIAVFISAWNFTGRFVNGYSIWLLLWLGFVALILALLALGGWLSRDD